MATSSEATTVSTKKPLKKRKADGSVDQQSTDASATSTAGQKKEKDRIKTLEQFQEELNLLMKTSKEHKAAATLSKEKLHEEKRLRSRIVPFMLENLKQTRVNCKDYNMYVSTSVVNRQRKVQIQDIYKIIEETLGTENKALIQKKALELRQQKVAMRQVVIKDIQDSRAKKRKEKQEEAIAAALAGRPIEKKRSKKQ